MKAKTVSESLKNDSNFQVGDFVRWSSPGMQNGYPAVYGIIERTKRGGTVSIKILGRSPHSYDQPTSRNETWLGGKHVPWEGFSEEELRETAEKMGDHQIGDGFSVNKLSRWIP
jgi:hypothetical protein